MAAALAYLLCSQINYTRIILCRIVRRLEYNYEKWCGVRSDFSRIPFRAKNLHLDKVIPKTNAKVFVLQKCYAIYRFAPRDE